MSLNCTTVGHTLNPSILTSILNSPSFSLMASAFVISRSSDISGHPCSCGANTLISNVGLSDGNETWSCLSVASSSFFCTDLLSFSLMSDFIVSLVVVFVGFGVSSSCSGFCFTAAFAAFLVRDAVAFAVS